MTNEADLLFYKGIPSSMCKKIRCKIPEAHQTAASPPSITSVLGYLRDEFDVDDIDDDWDNTEFAFNLDQDFNASDIEDEIKPPIK
jgi:hypothetical protein